MDDLNDVYNELIMEHSMNSYNKRKLENADFSCMGHNPNCGDEITLEIKLNGNIIEDMAFSGHGCAISQASTSIMIDTLKGKTIDEARVIIENYMNMIFEKDYDPEILEEAIAFYNTHKQANRIKCATLGWKGITQLIDESEKEETHGK